jgi:hypothetical protein
MQPSLAFPRTNASRPSVDLPEPRIVDEDNLVSFGGNQSACDKKIYEEKSKCRDYGQLTYCLWCALVIASAALAGHSQILGAIFLVVSPISLVKSLKFREHFFSLIELIGNVFSDFAMRLHRKFRIGNREFCEPSVLERLCSEFRMYTVVTQTQRFNAQFLSRLTPFRVHITIVCQSPNAPTA